MLTKRAITAVPIDDLLARRWSCRAFEVNKPVSREQVIALCEAGRWSPSCNGEEPWRFLVWDKNHDFEAWERAFYCLNPGNQKWVKNAPVLFAAIAGSQFKKEGVPDRWGQFDTGAASMSIYLQAVSMGLMAHPMGGFDSDKLRSEFNIPVEYTPMAMIAVGYQGEADILEPYQMKAELGERKRQHLGTEFFDGQWEKPIIA